MAYITPALLKSYLGVTGLDDAIYQQKMEWPRIVRSVQRLGAGPLLATATSRRAALPGPACSISTSSSLTASTSMKSPPAIPALLVSEEPGHTFLFIHS